MIYDYAIIGGGIVGLSTAWQLQQRFPDKRILLLEKEAEFARHQTGHNSGVIHAGVYYQPGSLKARFCREGVQATLNFCRQHSIPFEQCGKLLVATTTLEFERMQALFDRCRANGIEVQWLEQDELCDREPNISGLGAILVPSTGIVDYREVCNQMAECFRQLGGETRLNCELTGARENAELVTLNTLERGRGRGQEGGLEGTLQCRYLISCSGLMADRITRMLGIETDFQIVPFRGEYYRLPAQKSDIVRHLIYPIPDPDLPFLGVHLTRMIDGSVTVGPNAVQGWKREGYGRINFSICDVLEMLRFPGFWKVAAQNLRTGLIEIKNSWWKPGYLKLVQKYCPSVTLQDLQPYPAGVRAQAVLNDGTLVHDFLFAESARSLHVCNAPSPAATSAIPIGNYIVDQIVDKSIDKSVDKSAGEAPGKGTDTSVESVAGPSG